LIDLRKDDTIAAVCVVPRQDEEDEEEMGETPTNENPENMDAPLNSDEKELSDN